MTTVRQVLPTAVGRTHASIVIPVVRSSELGVRDRDELFRPLKVSALPNLAVPHRPMWRR